MPIAWGIIGCGEVTEAKSGPAFQQARDSHIVAVMCRRPAFAEDWARRHGVPKWYAEVDALIEDPAVDAVYVATPPGSHLEYALRVAAAGKPAYVEKPMARSFAEAALMVERFRRAGQPLFVAYYRRALDRFLKLRELIGSGRIGRLTSLSYRYFSGEPRRAAGEPLPWRLRAVESGGGLFLDLGCHLLDLLDFLFGPLERVSGTAENLASDYQVEDSVAMRFATADGVPGVASWSFAAHTGGGAEDRLEIIGNEGRIELSLFGSEPIRVSARDGHESLAAPNPYPIQRPLIQTIVDELQGRGRCPSDGESAARTSRVMDLVLEDYYLGRDDAFWARPETWRLRR